MFTHAHTHTISVRPPSTYTADVNPLQASMRSTHNAVFSPRELLKYTRKASTPQRSPGPHMSLTPAACSPHLLASAHDASSTQVCTLSPRFNLCPQTRQALAVRQNDATCAATATTDEHGCYGHLLSECGLHILVTRSLCWPNTCQH